MKGRKIGLAVIFALILAVKTVALGWSIASSDSRKEIVASFFEVVFVSYILGVSLWSIFLSDIYTHWRSILHLSGLTTLAFVALGTPAILPLSKSSPETTSVALHTTLSLYFFATLVAIRTKRGPKLHFPIKSIYSEKTIANTTSFAEDNVCGITG